MTFFLILLILAAILFIAVPVWRSQYLGKVGQAELRRQKNIEVFEQSKQELEDNYRQGLFEADEFARLTTELERNFLRDMEEGKTGALKLQARYTKALPLLLMLGIPIASILLYRNIGFEHELELPVLIENLNNAQSREQQMRSLNGIAEVLEGSFQRRGDPQSGFSLGTLYLGLEQFESAERIFRQLATRVENGDRATVLGQLAQAQYLGAGSNITPALEATMREALAINANQPSIMSILAIEAFFDEDYQGAVDYWRRQLSQLPPGSAEVAALNQRISMVENMLAEQGQAPVPFMAAGEDDSPATVGVTVEVSIDDAIRARIPEGMRVFVFARGTDMPVPLAAQTFAIDDLPLTVRLDDSMAMTPQFTLSSASTIYVGARISRQATPEPGDFEVLSEAFEISAQQDVIRLVIKENAP